MTRAVKSLNIEILNSSLAVMLEVLFHAPPLYDILASRGSAMLMKNSGIGSDISRFEEAAASTGMGNKALGVNAV